MPPNRQRKCRIVATRGGLAHARPNYGLKRMSLREGFRSRNDKDWISLGAGGRVFHREMADGKKEFWKDEVLEGGQSPESCWGEKIGWGKEEWS